MQKVLSLKISILIEYSVLSLFAVLEISNLKKLNEVKWQFTSKYILHMQITLKCMYAICSILIHVFRLFINIMFMEWTYVWYLKENSADLNWGNIIIIIVPHPLVSRAPSCGDFLQAMVMDVEWHPLVAGGNSAELQETNSSLPEPELSTFYMFPGNIQEIGKSYTTTCIHVPF